MGDTRSLRSRTGARLEEWVRHLACLGWTPPPELYLVSDDAIPRPNLDEQLDDLFRTVRQQELLWKPSRRPKSERGKAS